MSPALDAPLLALLRRTHAPSRAALIALDAVERLGGPDGEGWRAFYLGRQRAYLQGATAPARAFRDGLGLVLHVHDHDWGGALEASEFWYAKLVRSLANRAWREAAYSAGALSQAFTGPFHPLNAAQSEEAGAVRAGLEAALFDEHARLRALMAQDLGGWPAPFAPRTPDWLIRMVRAGALAASAHHRATIDRFDPVRGWPAPRLGLDDTLRATFARLNAQAATDFAAVLERAAARAGATPPPPRLLRATAEALARTPLALAHRLHAQKRRRALAGAALAELGRTGKVVQALEGPARHVRAAHAAEILRLPLAKLDGLPARLPGTRHGEQDAPAAPVVATARRALYTRASPIDLAPTVGPRTAARFARIGVATLGDLIRANPEPTAERLALAGVGADAVRDWADMARLVIEAPGLRAADAQLLVLAGVRDVEALARLDAAMLLRRVQALLGRAQAKGEPLGEAQAPALADARGWIAAARAVAA